MRSAHRARRAHVSPLGSNRRRVSLAGALLVVSVGALLGCGPAIAATAPPTPAPSYLFSIPTASGTLTGPSGRQLTLRLIGARDYLTRFTDRPLRDASVVANVDFARRFKTYFANSAPNAVLTYTPSGARIPVSIVLTVKHPRWSADHDTWTYCPVAGHHAAGQRRVQLRTDPAQFRAAVLHRRSAVPERDWWTRERGLLRVAARSARPIPRRGAPIPARRSPVPRGRPPHLAPRPPFAASAGRCTTAPGSPAARRPAG
jgi:hypothetical protein